MSASLLNSELTSTPLETQGTPFRCYAGSPFPFGSTVASTGTNFAIYSASADSAQLLIFNKPDDLDPSRVVDLCPKRNRSFNIWHVFVEGVHPGMGYAYRFDGSRDLASGCRFDPEKVLIDPYSKGNTLKHWNRGDACRPGDNLHSSMRSVVIDLENYDWEGDRPINRSMADTIIYEMHVGGFTKVQQAELNTLAHTWD